MSSSPAEATSTHHESLFRRIISWLSVGYPRGVPVTERYALLALLKRTLTDDEIKQVVAALTDGQSPARVDGVITEAEIEQMSARVLLEPPSQEDIGRVSARLAAAGWPLEGTGDLHDDR